MLHELLIDKNDVDVFGKLIPQMYRNDLKNERLFGIAAFDDVILFENLVGVILMRVKYQWQEIVWVSLTDKYSLPEYAADLIKNRTENVREQGMLLGTFSEFPVQEITRKDYFSCAGFSYDVIPSRVFQIYTQAVMKIPVFLSEEEESHCFQLRHITKIQKEKMEKNALSLKSPSPLELPIDWDSYDKYASVLYERNGEIEGALLLCKFNEFYSIEGIFGQKTEVFETMFMYMNKLSTEVLADRPLLLIPSVTETVEEALTNAPFAFTDDIAIVWRSYENTKIRKNDLNEDINAIYEDKYLLALENMDVCEKLMGGYMFAFINNSVNIYDGSAREKEEVYERHWRKIEDASKRIGFAPIVLIQQKIAKEAYDLYKSGKAEAVRLTDRRLMRFVPVSVKERTKIAQALAGLLVRSDELREEIKKEPPKGLYEEAKYTVNKKILSTLDNALDSFFSITGKRVHTGEKLSKDERIKLMTKTRSILAKLGKFMTFYENSIVEEMILRVREEESFKQQLKEQIEESEETNNLAYDLEYKKLKTFDIYLEKKDAFDHTMTERKKLIDKLSSLTAEITVLRRRKEFSEYGKIIDNIYFDRIRTLSYYIDSTESYLQYLYNGSPIGAMQGIFIRQKLQNDAPCPNPDIKLEEQIKVLCPKFEKLAPWEMDGATVFLAWQRMQHRLGTDKKEKPVGENIDLETLRGMIKALERKKSKHPELFRELMLTTLFHELPDIVDILGDALVVRDAAVHQLEDGFLNLEEKYDIYIRASAIYDTLLCRARYIIGASRRSMNELIKLQPDYRASDYEYVLRFCKKIAERR